MDLISVQADFHSHMARNPQYLAKKQAEKNSYVWDRLIEAFTTHMLDGTTIVPDGQPFVLSELEEGVRHMAVVPRHLRRMLGDGILDALRKATKADRFTRGFLPRPNDPEQDTGFFFMTLSVPAFKLSHGYEQYRSLRRAMLETYAFSFLPKESKAKASSRNRDRASDARSRFIGRYDCLLHPGRMDLRFFDEVGGTEKDLQHCPARELHRI